MELHIGPRMTVVQPDRQEDSRQISIANQKKIKEIEEILVVLKYNKEKLYNITKFLKEHKVLDESKIKSIQFSYNKFKKYRADFKTCKSRFSVVKLQDDVLGKLNQTYLKGKQNLEKHIQKQNVLIQEWLNEASYQLKQAFTLSSIAPVSVGFLPTNVHNVTPPPQVHVSVVSSELVPNSTCAVSSSKSVANASTPCEEEEFDFEDPVNTRSKSVASASMPCEEEEFDFEDPVNTLAHRKKDIESKKSEKKTVSPKKKRSDIYTSDTGWEISQLEIERKLSKAKCECFDRSNYLRLINFFESKDSFMHCDKDVVSLFVGSIAEEAVPSTRLNQGVAPNIFNPEADRGSRSAFNLPESSAEDRKDVSREVDKLIKELKYFEEKRC